MLALKKKREMEAKAAANAATSRGVDSSVKKLEKISLLGIGGVKKGKNDGKTTGKKRSPGEIRKEV